MFLAVYDGSVFFLLRDSGVAGTDKFPRTSLIGPCLFAVVDFLNFQTVGSPSIEGPPCLSNPFQIDAVFSLQNTVCSLCNTHLERS